jgi:hypothetical protein
MANASCNHNQFLVRRVDPPKTQNHIQFHNTADIAMPWSTVSPRHIVPNNHEIEVLGMTACALLVALGSFSPTTVNTWSDSVRVEAGGDYNTSTEDGTNASLSKSERRRFDERSTAYEYALAARTVVSGLLIMELASRTKSHKAVFLALFASACTTMTDIRYVSPYWSTARTNAYWGFVFGSAFLGFFGASRARMESCGW